MIEKLDSKMDCVEITLLGKVTECLGFDSAKEIGKKLNELVDAVNKLQLAKDVMFNRIDMLNDAICDVRIRITALEDPTYHEELAQADPYAEQRKWIGKLCRFWDDNYKITKHFGILTRIDETAIVRYEAGNGFWYCACEPVKPDDDIIYKGENNE